MTEVLVVDDDFVIQRMTRAALEKENYAVRTANDAESALVELRKRAPDLVLLDVRMPGMSGFDLCRKMREDPTFKGLPVIFLTSKVEESSRVAGLELGGDDYIVKPYSAAELLARIKAVLRRLRPAGDASETLSAGNLSVNPSEMRASLDGAPLALTRKEFELLSLFLKKKKRALGRALIFEEVWRQEYTATSRTLDTHVNSLRRKLGALGACIQTVENVGYRWVDPSGDSRS